MTMIAWWLYILGGVFGEGSGVFGHGVPLTTVMIGVRLDQYGRFAAWGMCLWLFYHWMLNAGRRPTGWRDLVFLGIGVGIALLEVKRGKPFLL